METWQGQFEDAWLRDACTTSCPKGQFWRNNTEIYSQTHEFQIVHLFPNTQLSNRLFEYRITVTAHFLDMPHQPAFLYRFLGPTDFCEKKVSILIIYWKMISDSLVCCIIRVCGFYIVNLRVNSIILGRNNVPRTMHGGLLAIHVITLIHVINLTLTLTQNI